MYVHLLIPAEYIDSLVSETFQQCVTRGFPSITHCNTGASN